MFFLSKKKIDTVLFIEYIEVLNHAYIYLYM